MSKQNFDKFINKKVAPAKKKEQIKQEKRAAKKEREAFFIEKKRQMRAEKKLQQAAAFEEAKKTATNKTGKKEDKKATKEVKADKAFKGNSSKPFNEEANNSYKEKKQNWEKDKKEGKKTAEEKSAQKVVVKEAPVKSEKKSTTAKSPKERKRIPLAKEAGDTRRPNDPGLPYARKELKAKEIVKTPIKKLAKKAADSAEAQMPLNKFIAHGGVCSRRDAGDLVKAGKVKVNNEVITEPGYKVQPEDKVTVNGKKVTAQVNLVYILLNKPKDYITTAEDPQGRKTVMELIKTATTERVYPVGRLDRNTSGVLLLTNDGELAQQLTHPSFEIKKIYEAKLDKPLAKADFDKLLSGITLEDGEIHADSVAYADSKDKSIIGIEIHSGRNRIVRRMFEALGYDVKGLDRVMFANLTKKNVDRSNWRLLTEKEVRSLKYFQKGK